MNEYGSKMSKFIHINNRLPSGLLWPLHPTWGCCQYRVYSDADGRVLGVYGLPHVVQTRGAEDDAARAREAGEGEEQQEEAVQHHRDGFPVLHHLVVLVIVILLKIALIFVWSTTILSNHLKITLQSLSMITLHEKLHYFLRRILSNALSENGEMHL